MPTVGHDKTLHQRYKSTGNLPTMVTVGGLRAAAKRTAFGDLTNTSRNSHSSKDDSVLNTKGTLLGGTKTGIAPFEKKSLALLRPAQRPLSVAGIKGLLNKENSTSSSVSTTATVVAKTNGAVGVKQVKAAATKEVPLAQALPVAEVVSRKNNAQRATTIFQDSAIVEEKKRPLEEAQPKAPTPPVHQTLAPPSSQYITAPVPPVHQTLAPRHHKSQPYLRAEQPLLRKTQSRYVLSPSQVENEDDKENSLAHLSLLSSDPILPEVDDNEYHESSQHANAALPCENIGSFEYYEEEFLPLYEYADAAEAQAKPVSTVTETIQTRDLHSVEPELPIHQQRNSQLVQSLLEERDRHAEEDLKAKANVANELLAVAELTEPEEYWDDELDDEIYEDDGYTTARSCYSRGDNTTGGATTVLIPKMTNKVRKELAVAKEIVESTRTMEEVLDESYDSTMVTEYGDEIFQYMRDLEVSQPTPPDDEPRH